MRATRVLLQQRKPMIKFIGKRGPPPKVDHTPHAHPASPTHELPGSFASYRKLAQQHGPLGGHRPQPASAHGGIIASHSGASLGPVEPAKGQYFDRSELPARFRNTPWSQAEIDAVESGGASILA